MATGYIGLTKESLQNNEGVAMLNAMLESLYELVPGDADTVRVYKGYGIPTLAAGIGSLYLRQDGIASNTLYIREPLGWRAV